ncbi:MAG: ribosomal protein S18-alanine N-acetyltransferase [Ruminococcus sp.]|nr:ribosomal protein S18-alanine N-acetyltransferase [Ruminococcus sp.]
MSDIVVKSFTRADALAAAQIEEEIFSHGFKSDDFLRQTEDGSLVLAAKKGDTLVGYISISVVLDEASINTIAVREDFRRQGAANKLLERAIDELESRCVFLTLEVRRRNVAAVSLYERFGFRKVGERRGYYSDPDDDALLMTRFFK